MLYSISLFYFMLCLYYASADTKSTYDIPTIRYTNTCEYIYKYIHTHMTSHHITSHHNAVHNIMLHIYHNVCTGCMDIICVHYNIKCIYTVEINK